MRPINMAVLLNDLFSHSLTHSPTYSLSHSLTHSLTQEELLAEAARTELDNLASLKQLLAQEEETKKKANTKKQRFGGPLVRFRSRTIQVLVPPEVAKREREWQQQSQQQQQQQQVQLPAAAGAADGSAGVKGEPAAAGATPAATAAAANAAPAGAGAAPASDAAATAAAAAGAGDAAGAAQGASDEATPMQIDQQPPQQQQQEQQPAAAPPEPELPSGPSLQRQALDTLQCLGMKAPKWLLPQRAPGAPNKPICPITGGVARYRDPLTGHWYSDSEAFRELRRRLGQPLPPLQPYRRAAASPAAELKVLLDATAAAGAAAVSDPAAAAAAAGAAAGEGGQGVQAGGQQQQGLSGGGGLPPGQLALQEYVEAYMQQQLAVAGSKGRGKSQASYYQQASVPDEVAALVLQVSQAVHG